MKAGWHRQVHAAERKVFAFAWSIASGMAANDVVLESCPGFTITYKATIADICNN